MRHPIENPSPAAADREVLSGIFDAALAAADPCQAVLNAVRVDGDSLLAGGAQYDLASFERIIVVGAGKATARMAQAAEALLGSRISAGLIVVKDGHTGPLKIVEQVEASHPVPNQAGIAGTQRLLQLVRDAGEKTLVLCLLSGGASALLVAPADGVTPGGVTPGGETHRGVTLQDKQETTRLLLNAGASINELNAVRKHLSAVKGGGLARAAYPAQLLTLIVSDVIGDPLDVIGSGPTSPDDSTFAEAAAVIDKFGLRDSLPPRVAGYLRRGSAGQQPETVKAGDPCLANTHNVIVAGIRQALAAAAAKAERLGYTTRTIDYALQGEARDAARFLAQAARAELDAMQAGERRCLLSGGETTVTVRGDGMGGRNQELALAFALQTEGWQGVSLLSAGTDGSDGPNDAAGAFVDGTTAARARSLDIDPAAYLGNNDSYTLFQRLDAAAGTHSHFKTGPTGTNVMDIQILLLAK